MKTVLKFLAVFFVATSFIACSDDDPGCTPDFSLQEETISVNMLAENHYQGYTDIIINASVEEVWSVLTDWENMPSWSSSLQGISGDITNGGQVIATYSLQGEFIEIPHTLIYEEGVRFGWSDPTGPATLEPFGGFVDNHQFIVERISDCQTRFIQSDDFTGAGNATYDSEGIATFVTQFYPVFNRELKAEVESR